MEQQVLKISPLTPLTYSELLNNIDQNKENNSKSRYNFLNLQMLVENFRLDDHFIAKSYYQNIPEYAFNDPPKGPIPKYFECIHCEQSGTDFHLKNCIKPFDSSLYLTQQGEGFYKRPVGTSYKLIVKKRGQKKVVSTSVKNQRFSDNVELVYINSNDTHTIIKIGKNGVVNIISGNFTDSQNLKNGLITKINETGALNTEQYGSARYKIDPDISYVYLILAQFNLYPKEFKFNFINLDAINLNLWETPLFRQRVGNKDFFVLSPKRYQVENYRYNSGSITSRSNKTTNPFIQFDLTVNEIFKVGILIYKKGAVQMRLSYLDKRFTDRIDNPLNLNILETVYKFLKQLFTILIENSSTTNYPIIANEVIPEKRGILNMVDGKQPLVCHNRKGYELRPVPYSFYGTCPMQNYYVRPEGKPRPDGKFEPCCYKIKKSGKDSQEYIQNLYRNGYLEVEDPDKFSAVFRPGTKTVESRRFKGLDTLSQKELLDFMEKHGYIGRSSPFSINSFSSSSLQFEKFSQLNNIEQIKGTLMVSIPNEVIRVFLEFDKSGKTRYIDESGKTTKSGKGLPDLALTVIDGFLDIEEMVFYPFDIPIFKGEIISFTFKKRFDILMYAIEIINENSEDLSLSTNFDDSVENLLNEQDNFIIFIKPGSFYTPGIINKGVKIWKTEMDSFFISLNIHAFKLNRWNIDFNGKKISEILIPQRENSVELPVIFTKSIRDNDIVVFKINTNQNRLINHNKPLIPVEKVDKHIMDYQDLINILEHVKTPLKREQLIS